FNAETGQHEPYTQKIVWDPVPGAEKYLVWVKYGTAASTAATASWDRLAVVPADQIQKVRVSVGGPEVDKVYLVSTALNLDKTFGYRVQAINGAGKSVMSAEAYGKTPWDLPLPPENLLFTGSTLNTISMSWYDPNDNEDGHIVYRQPVPPTTGFVEIARVVPGTPGFGGITFTDNATTNPSSPPAPSTCYNYVVEAYNTAGNSGWNANGPVQMCTKGVPGAPTNLFAIAASATQVNLTWDAATGLVNGYRLERSISGQTTPAVPISLPADATSYSDMGLLPGTTYIYVLYAVNAAGDSAPSNQASAQTPAGPPAAPTNLVALPSLPSPFPPVVTLTWTDNAGNESGFIIQRAVDNNGTPGAFTEIARTTTASTGTGQSVSYTDNSVAPKMTYWYRVASYNNSGQSDFTPQVMAVTSGEVPEAPADLRIARMTRTSVSLTWLDKSTNEIGFRLQRSLDGATWSDYQLLPANTSSFTDNAVNSRVTYYYRVQAYNNDGNSAFSNVASVRVR
ncbi:MAG: fibronectin type III domain-containing protein, partial [Caldilineaceae bacterium]|nr:fibronectin type III domain-containing protein [Caldilineaceae bacterium]